MNIPGLHYGDYRSQSRYISRAYDLYRRGNPKFYRLLVKTGLIRPQRSGFNYRGFYRFGRFRRRRRRYRRRRYYRK
jgi:hypothetical protein